MKSDLLLLEELGDSLRPPAEQPPADLRRHIAGNAPPARTGPARNGPAANGPSLARDAGQILQLAAQHSAAVPALPARPDQFVYVEAVKTGFILHNPGRTEGGRNVVDVEVDAPRLGYAWHSVDGTHDGLLRDRPWRSGDADWASAPLPGCRDGRYAPTLDRPGHTEECTPYPAYRADLPTDAEAMLRYLYRPGDDAGDIEPDVSADQKAFMRVAEVIRTSLPAPAVQAAVFRAAARIPGVTVIQDATDVAGRHGVAVARTDGGVRAELIFDGSTYQYLGTNESIVDADAFSHGNLIVHGLHPGDVYHQEAILRAALVDRPGQLP
ncbi:MAG: hypothetical protein AUI14_16520 [Actinobacteria bacterium 13_2_20CM_2_71_6]|nr:MAG: hypothetical protein AUI14_16520 [Actinobacteria bacterium 13_2_20CM_2_71_6]